MSIKLLFADDSVTMQKVIQLTLENENVDLLFAGDGKRALDIAREAKPDVVIADVYMPGLDGFQLCEKLKAEAPTANIPVILISGELEQYDPEKGKAAGAEAHITKPFKSGEFIELIKRVAGAGAPSKKQGKAKAAPAAPVVELEDEDEAEGIGEEPEVLELIERLPGARAAEANGDEELEVVDEDIDDLAEELDEFEDDLAEEVMDEGEEEAEVAALAPPPQEPKGKVELDDMLPTTDEVDRALTEEAAAEAALAPEERIVFDHDADGEVVAEAYGAELPPAADEFPAGGEEGEDAAQILADVLNVVESAPLEQKEETRREETALEETLAALEAAEAPAPSRAVEEFLKEEPETPAPYAPEDDLWGKSLEEVDEVLEKTEVEQEMGREEEVDSIWDAPKRELEEAVRREVETFAPPLEAPAGAGLPMERMEELFREAASRAVEDFIAARAEEVFREEMRRAIEERVKEAFASQLEKAFREEIGKVMAAGFQKAMPRMLAIIDKITVQITPRIAQHMIKIAIERIKKGEIN